MDDNQPKDIVPKKSDGLSKASELAKRGLQIAQSPTSVQHSSSLSQFLDSVGGIPDNNTDLRFQEINDVLGSYFSKMTMEEISKELEVEFQKRPNGRTLKLIGFSYFHEGRFDNAIEILTNCLKITTEDPVAVYEYLGRCYVLKGDRENAGRWFAASYRYDFEFFLEVFGWDLLYVTAVGRYRTRPPIFGESDDELSTRAVQIEAMADALSMCYGNKKGHKSLANAYVESIILEMAEEYASDSLKAIEDTKTIKDTTIQLLQELKTSDVLKQAVNVVDSLPYYNLGVLLASQNRLKEAEEAFHKAIIANPKSAQAYYNLAIIFEDQKLLIQAENNYQKAIAIDPSFVQAYNNLGILLLNLNQVNEAEYNFRKAIQIDPNHESAYTNLSILLIDQNRLKEAENLFRKAIMADSNLAPTYYDIGALLANQGRLKEAEEIYRMLTKLNPDDANAYLSLGILLARQGYVKAAEEAWREATRANPHLDQAYYNLGVIFEDQNRLLEAESAYRKATVANPNYAQAYNNLGLLLANQNRLKEAEEAYRKGIIVGPNNALIYSNLGLLLAHQDHYKEAEAAYRKAITIDPNLALAHYNLGLLFKRQNRLQEANSMISKALQLNPNLE